MPSVSHVKGQPAPNQVSNQPTKLVVPEPVGEAEPISASPVIEQPEPAIPIDKLPRPTQDELAAISIASQTVAQRNAMTPSTQVEPKLTDEQRVAQAKAAIEARWSKRFDWENSPVDLALEYLAELRLETEKGGLVLQRRVSEMRVERVKCFSCENIINISEGRWATYRTRNNYETGMPETAYACSAACALKLNRDFVHPTTRTQ